MLQDPFDMSHDPKTGLRNEQGSVLTALFVGIALLGFLSYTTYNLLNGPVRSAATVSMKTKAQADASLAAKILMRSATEIDGDGLYEPPGFVTTGSVKPVGGGTIPPTVGAAKIDPWRTPYGYCGWDVQPGGGAIVPTGTTLLQGSASTDPAVYGATIVVAVISAGPNRKFDTTCANDPAYLSSAANSDDIVESYTFDQAVSLELWKKRSAGTAIEYMGDNVVIGNPVSAVGADRLQVEGNGLIEGNMRVTGNGAINGVLTTNSLVATSADVSGTLSAITANITNLAASGGTVLISGSNGSKMDNVVIGSVTPENGKFIGVYGETGLFSGSLYVNDAVHVQNDVAAGSFTSTGNSSLGTVTIGNLITPNTGLVANLNADLLDGQQGAFYQNADNLITGTVDAARLPSLNGDVTGAVSATSVVRLRGFPVVATPPTANTVLGWNGSAWAPMPIGDGTGGTVGGGVPNGNTLILPINGDNAPASARRIITINANADPYLGYAGTNNLYLGKAAGKALDGGGAGQRNVYIGDNAGKANASGVNNVYIGQGAGQTNPYGGDNVFIGYNTGTNSNVSYSVIIGSRSGPNSTGNSNTFVGSYTGAANTYGNGNAFSGASAGTSNTTGSNNVFTGSSAGYSNTTGGANVFIGVGAASSSTSGDYNTDIGTNSGFSMTTGSYNTFLGYQAAYNASQKKDAVNSIALGYNTFTTADNQTVIGNTNVTSTIIRGAVTLPNLAGTGVRPVSADANGVLKVGAAGATGAAAGADGNVQYNDTGNLAGSNNFFWDKTNKRLGVGTAAPQKVLHVSGADNTGASIAAAIENTSTGGASYASLLFRTAGSDDGTVFGGKSALNAYGIVNGLNLGPGSATQDIGFRVGAALSGSGTGPAVVIKANGNVVVQDLTGVGSRQVLVDANGILTAGPAAGGGGGGVTIAAGQVAYATAANTLGGSSGFVWNNATSTLQLTGKLQATGTITASLPHTATATTKVLIDDGGVISHRTLAELFQDADNAGAGSVSLPLNADDAPSPKFRLIGINAGADPFLGYRGSYNVYLGAKAGAGLDGGGGGTDNTFVGTSSGEANTSGSQNTFFGAYSGEAAAGAHNTLMGFGAGANIQADNNVFLGYQSGSSASTTTESVSVGAYSGLNNNGNRNVFVGAWAGNANVNGIGLTLIGSNAGIDNTGDWGTFVGMNAGRSNTSGTQNTFVGGEAGFSNTTGPYNTFIGKDAGRNNTTAGYNTFIGYSAGTGVTTGGNNTFIGWAAGNLATTAVANTFVGKGSGLSVTTGQSNLLLGDNTGSSITNAIGNTLIGTGAGTATTGGYNTFLGYIAGTDSSQLTTATNSMALGNGTFTTASNQTVIGNTSVTSTVIRGAITLPNLAGTGSRTVVADANGVLSAGAGGSGDVAGPASSTDNALARYDGTTGKLLQNSGVYLDDANNLSVNTTSAIGKLSVSAAAQTGLYVENQGSLANPTGVFKNTTGGSYASIDVYGGPAITNSNKFQFGQYDTGDTFFYLVGNNNLDYYTNSTRRMRISGAGVLTVDNLSGTGSRMVVANASGVLSTQAIPSGGSGSLPLDVDTAPLKVVINSSSTSAPYLMFNGTDNVALGNQAGLGIFYGSTGTTAAGNVLIGANAGRTISTGSSNVILGAISGFSTNASNSTFLGYQSGYNTTGNDNTFLGYSMGMNVTSGVRNINIGSNISSAAASNDMFLVGNGVIGTFMQGDMSTGPLQVKGGTTTLSDARLKKSVVTLDNSLNKVMALRGVSYQWKPEYRQDKRTYVGFIAQEVQKILPEVIYPMKQEDGKEYLTVSYEQFAPLLVEAIKTQQTMITAQAKEIDDLKNRMDRLEKMVMANSDAKVSQRAPAPVSTTWFERIMAWFQSMLPEFMTA